VVATRPRPSHAFNSALHPHTNSCCLCGGDVERVGDEQTIRSIKHEGVGGKKTLASLRQEKKGESFPRRNFFSFPPPLSSPVGLVCLCEERSEALPSSLGKKMNRLLFVCTHLQLASPDRVPRAGTTDAHPLASARAKQTNARPPILA
jgi:hypothetical protein